MISLQTQNLINKRWPNIKDNKVLLQNVRRAVISIAYPFSKPKNASDNFVKKAQRNAKSMRFAAGGLVIFAALTFIDESTKFGAVTVCADTFEKLIVAFILYYFYKSFSKLITCYNELMCESSQTQTNYQEPQILSTP